MKKIISTILACVLTITSMAVTAFADEPVAEDTCPIMITAEWSNYTVANLKLTFPSDNSVASANVKLAPDFYFDGNVNKITKDIKKSGSNRLDLNLQDTNATEVKVIDSITVTYADNSEKTFSNIGISLEIKTSLGVSVKWNGENWARVDLFSSNFATINGVPVSEFTDIQFKCVLEEPFLYEKNGDGKTTFKGLADNKKGASEVIWKFNTKEWNSNGNGVYFMANWTKDQLFVDGEIPVFKSITIIGTKADGTTAEETSIDVSDIKLNINDIGFEVKAFWDTKATAGISVTKTDITAQPVRNNIIDDSFATQFKLNETNFTYSEETGIVLNENYEKNEDGTVTLGTMTVKAQTKNGRDSSVEHEKEVLITLPIPTVNVTLVDGNNKKTVPYPIYSELTAPTAAGMSGSSFNGWTINGDAVAFPLTLTNDITLTASYSVIPTENTSSNPVIVTPAAPIIDIEDENAALADSPDAVTNNEEDEASADGLDIEMPIATNPSTGDNSIAGTAALIAVAAIGVAVVAMKRKK